MSAHLHKPTSAAGEYGSSQESNECNMGTKKDNGISNQPQISTSGVQDIPWASALRVDHLAKPQRDIEQGGVITTAVALPVVQSLEIAAVAMGDPSKNAPSARKQCCKRLLVVVLVLLTIFVSAAAIICKLMKPKWLCAPWEKDACDGLFKRKATVSTQPKCWDEWGNFVGGDPMTCIDNYYEVFPLPGNTYVHALPLLSSTCPDPVLTLSLYKQS